MKSKYVIQCFFCGGDIDLTECQVLAVSTPNTISGLPGIAAEDVRMMCPHCKCWNGNKEDNNEH